MNKETLPISTIGRKRMEKRRIRNMLTFKDLHEKGLKRMQSLTGFNHRMGLWDEVNWTNAVAGEAGEACNLSKKLSRFNHGIQGNIKPEDQDRSLVKQRLMLELGDVIIYAALAISNLGGEPESVVRTAFNNKSHEIGSEVML